MWDIYDKIDRLADEIGTTEDSLQILQSAYDAIMAQKFKASWEADAAELSRRIHQCQDALLDLKDERDALIDLLFD